MTNPSGSKLRDFYAEIVAEAEAEGPKAIAELEAWRNYFRLEPNVKPRARRKLQRTSRY
jgi:hypothetical protein